MRPIVTAALALSTLLVCSGCSGTSPGASPTTGSTLDHLCASEIVVDCATDSPLIIVTVSASASDADTVDLAHDLHAATSAAMSDSHAQTLLRRESTSSVSLDPEFSTPEPWTVQVQPADRDAMESELATVLAIEDVPGALGIRIDDSWPSITVDTLARFGTAFDAASELEAFADGGTYRLLALDDRLRIVHTPMWVEPELVHEVIDIATDYPQAEVLLEAPAGGQTPPTLYIAKLSPAQVEELTVRLSSAQLADAVADGIRIEYVLGSTGEDGTTYISGLIAQPPA